MKKKFLQYCLSNKFHQNNAQIETLELLINFNKANSFKKKFLKLISKSEEKLGFYLHGEVGVGKTMLLNFFFNQLRISKKRMHFNEFMISFHDFRHIYKSKKKNNSIETFVNNLSRKVDLLYLDEFQVTNIVDAMILGRLFENIFNAKIKVLISSNIKINNLYKDGLQREYFLPFIKVIKKFSIEHEIVINQDYRRSGQSKHVLFFSPLNEQTTFKINQSFRQLTKDKKNFKVELKIKGRMFIINYFFEGFARFDFKDLCIENLGAEDYISIGDKCKFITLDNIPNFDDENINHQQRFITLIDILYEKKIPMMVSANFNLNNFTSSKKLIKPYKRTISRLFELTSPNFNKK